MKLKEAIDITVDYYNGHLPKTVAEYIQDFPKGLSRQVLKKRYGLTAGQFLKLLGAEYKEPNKAKDLIKVEAEKRNLKILSDLVGINVNTKVNFLCLDCGDTFSTTYSSLKLTTKGCQSCAGNKQLCKRPEFVKKCADKVNSSVLEIPSNNSLKVTLQCRSCSSIYKVILGKLTNPQTPLEGTCPNCRDTDRRVTYNSITFGSAFEFECYKLLRHLNPKLQVKYKDTFSTTRRWTCDFVIGDRWVEVSNFKSDYKGYFKNIEDKRITVESAGKQFFFLTSLKEVSDFINMI